MKTRQVSAYGLIAVLAAFALSLSGCGDGNNTTKHDPKCPCTITEHEWDDPCACEGKGYDCKCTTKEKPVVIPEDPECNCTEKEHDAACECPAAGTPKCDCTVKEPVVVPPVPDPVCDCPPNTVHPFGSGGCPTSCEAKGTEHCGCTIGPEPESVQNSPSVPMFADKTATIKTDDKFTDTQWNEITSAIAGKFSTAYNVASDNRKSSYESAFAAGITIIVEKNPVGYTNYKVSQDGSFLYVRASGVDNLDPVQFILAVNNGQELIAKALQAHDNGWQRYDIAKQRNDNKFASINTGLTASLSLCV